MSRNVTGERRKHVQRSRGLRPGVLVAAMLAPAVLALGLLVAELTGYEEQVRDTPRHLVKAKAVARWSGSPSVARWKPVPSVLFLTPVPAPPHADLRYEGWIPAPLVPRDGKATAGSTPRTGLGEPTYLHPQTGKQGWASRRPWAGLDALPGRRPSGGDHGKAAVSAPRRKTENDHPAWRRVGRGGPAWRRTGGDSPAWRRTGGDPPMRRTGVMQPEVRPPRMRQEGPTEAMQTEEGMRAEQAGGCAPGEQPRERVRGAEPGGRGRGAWVFGSGEPAWTATPNELHRCEADDRSGALQRGMPNA